jgi:hypothetical protein
MGKFNFRFSTWLGTKSAPFVAPWLLGLSVMPVALAAHWGWHDSPVWIAVLAVVATIVTWTTFITWGRRSEESRVIATVFAGLLLGWIVFAAASDPLDGNMVSAWLLGSAALGLTWGIRHAALKPGSDKDAPKAQPDPMLGAVQAFKGGRVRKIAEKAGVLKARVQLDPTVGSVDGVQSERETIAGLSAMGKDQVTVLPVEGRADQVDIAFSHPVDMKQLLAYPGPDHLGESVAAAPLLLGYRDDGSPIGYWLVGNNDPSNPRQLSHTKTLGMTGSGKTHMVKVAVCRMRERTDIVPVVGDPAKFAQSFGDIADMLEIAAKTRAECRQLIRNLPELVTYRSGLLGSLTQRNGRKSYPEWVPECWDDYGIPAIFIDIEEAGDVAGDMEDELDEAVRKLRSVGVHLMLSMQTAPHDVLARRTRGQFGQSLALGCQEMQDAKYALNPATLDAGADPTKWQNNSAGSVYAEMVGTDPKHWPVGGKIFGMTWEEMRDSAKTSKPFWAKLDPGSKMILGKGIIMQDEQVTAGLSVVPDDSHKEENNAVRDLTRVSTEDGDVVDVTQELVPPRAGSLVSFRSGTENRMGTEQARQLIENRISSLERDGKEDVGFGDLEDLTAVTGRGRGWVYGELKRLVQEGRLQELTGRPPYRIRSRSDAATG